MPDPTFHQLRQWGRGRLPPAAPVIGEIDPGAITVLDGPVPAARQAAPAIGEIDPDALKVWPDDSAAKKHLRDLIASKESPIGGYNAFYAENTEKGPKPGGDVSKMTLGEIYAFQDRLFRSSHGSTPVGRYQIRKETLQDLQRALGLPMTQVFDAALQDRLANKLFEWRGLNEYFGGKISAQKFQDRLKDEWAVIPEFGQQGKLSTEQVQDAISRFPRYGE